MVVIVLSYLLYWFGHAVSLLLDLLARWERPEWPVNQLYRLYCWAMGLSGDLDKNERIWLSRRDGETEEEFEARVLQRWPEKSGEE